MSPLLKPTIRTRAYSVATWLLVAVGLASAVRPALAQPIVQFDFTMAQHVQEWRAVHDVTRLVGTPEGLLIEISGADPYIHGPARDYPADQPLWLNIRLKTTRAGMAQVFFFSAASAANEADSVRFDVRANQWEQVRVPLPPLGPGYHLRLDPPPGVAGDRTVVRRLTVEARPKLEEPAWPKPTPPVLRSGALSVQSGDIELKHNLNRRGELTIDVAGQPMASGFNRPLIGYVRGNEQRWIDLAGSAKVEAWKEQNAIVVQAAVRDADGAEWALRQEFRPGATPDTLEVTSQVTVNDDRTVVFLPAFTILPGLGSFGTTKSQALFAGLEYLGKDEPSSSEADIIGPGARRQVPDSLKITFPLMAIQANDRYVGLIWENDPRFSALFDSPDRLFESGAHVMGILFPGSDGTNRLEGSLLPYAGETLRANQPLTLRATLIGGRGQSIVPAVQQYVALRGLPPVPQEGVEWHDYLATAASGWLDSAIGVDNQYRHAWPGGFQPQPAADAALMMDWLALQTNDANLKRRLTEAAEAALGEVRPADLNFAGVSHVRYPVPALAYRHAEENAARADEYARGLLTRFEPDGSVRYRTPPDRPDYGKTHFAPDANGLTADMLVRMLQAATFCGDRELIDEGLRLLRALDKFTNTVPRGAQTWEVPLHTPDILASAHLVNAYTLGYELTGEPYFLEQARYWAWTGVPFVYLVPPTDQPIGLYATIPVLGATNWVAPNWMGLPVQWCGLVYCDALYRLARHDPSGPWKQLADGITASGVQQTWPRGSDPSRQGLLPDSLALRAQTRNDAAINPGTVLANAVQFFDKPALYDSRVFRDSGLIVHAPGAICDATEGTGHVTFTVDAWPDHAYQVLIVGFRAAPQLRINGQAAPLAAPHHFDASAGRLILTLEGKPSLEIGFGSRHTYHSSAKSRAHMPDHAS